MPLDSQKRSDDAAIRVAYEKRGEEIERLRVELKTCRDTIDRMDRVHRDLLRRLADLPCLGSANGCHDAKELLGGRGSGRD